MITVYVKAKVFNYYGLAGFSYKYFKLTNKAYSACIIGGKVYIGDDVFESIFKDHGATSPAFTTKQEYQEATGDYSCDENPIKPEFPKPSKPIMRAKKMSLYEYLCKLSKLEKLELILMVTVLIITGYGACTS